MYDVVLALDDGKSEYDSTKVGPIVLKTVETEAEAKALMLWVTKDLQAKGLHIDHIRSNSNDFQGYENALVVSERKTQHFPNGPAELNTETDYLDRLHTRGFVWYNEST